MPDALIEQGIAAQADYAARFDNGDEIWNPSFIQKLPAFTALLRAAIAAGRPLTQADVERALGPVSWDW